MKILCIGDVVGRTGREMLFKYAEELKYKKSIDLIIANGENASHGRGMTRSVYDEMTRAGIEGFTMGNHTWDAKEIVDILKYEDNVIRPANYSAVCPGRGSMILKTKTGINVGVINIIGRTYLNSFDSPFDAVEREIKKLQKHAKIILVDFHAEATSEKEAMGYFLDGKVSAVFGTHTHVQTSDNKILPSGTGYITDLGMTGPDESVLGMNWHTIVRRFTTGMPQKFEVASGKGRFCACIFDIDAETGKCTDTERIYLTD